MPVVNRYGSRKVGTEALMGVRKTAAETPESQGAGLAEAQGQQAESLGRLAGTVGHLATQRIAEMQQQERDRADRVAVQEADTALGKWENQRLYDSQTGALTIQGKDAMPLPEAVGGEFNQVAGEIEQGLTTDRQKAAFAHIRANRAQNLDGTLRRHVFTAMQTYEAQTLQATVENAMEAAVANALDPRRVGQELDRAVGAIQVSAKRLGKSPETAAKEVGDVQTKTHVGVIGRLLTNNQTRAAHIYFEETKDQITGSALGQIEKALAVGNTRAEAQKAADAILAIPDLTLTQQREKARAIDDPEVRDNVQQRLEHEAAVKDKADRDRDETTLKNAYTLVDQSHDVNSIPPATWGDLSGPARASLRTYATSLAKGVPITTDASTFYSRMQEAGTDPDAFVTRNLLADRAKLDEDDWKKLVTLQLSLRKGDRPKADEQLAGFRTHSQIVDDTLSDYGIDPHAKPGTPEDLAISQLRRMLDRRVEAVQAPGPDGKAKKVSNTEVQQALDDILSTKETTPGSWWGLVPFTKTKFSDESHRVLDTTIEQVPAADRTKIESALRRAGRPVSDATIRDAYIELQVRKKARQ